MYPRAAALVLAMLLAAALFPPATAADPPLATQYAAPVPTVAADLNITVILAGFELNATEKAALAHAVAPYWWPFITAVKVPLGVNFTVHIDIVDAPQAFMNDYVQFLNDSFANDTLSRALGQYVGVFENVSAAFPAWSESTPVRHADAGAAANWLAGAGADFAVLAPSRGAARMVFLNPAQVTEPYYYTVNSLERDRGTALSYETANAWGDGDGLYFQDLRALPGHLGEFATEGRADNFGGFPPYWTYGTSAGQRDQLTTDLGHYIDTTVEQLIAPSFGVAPFQATSFKANITLFDATTAGTVLQPGGVGAAFGIEKPEDVLNTSLVEAALRDLVPYTTIATTVAVFNRTSDGELSNALAASSQVVEGARVVDPFALNTHLKTRWGVPNLPVEPGENFTVPVLLIMTEETAWVDTENIRGVTLQRGDGRAAGIVIAAGLEQLKDRAFSETVVHESGHALGFGHPHEISVIGGNGSVVTVVDWLHSLSSTPMTYLPSYVDYSFDSFDRHALWEGVAAVTLGEAYQLRQAAYAHLDALGYNTSTVPSAIASHEALFAGYANTTRDLLKDGILYVEANPPYSSGGAIVMAKHAYDEAREITTRAALTPRCCGTRPHGILPGFDAAAVALALGAAVAVAALARRKDD